LNLALDVRAMHVDARSGMGLEAAAREARYAAFAATLQPGESLLTAHHQDDQVETVLLKLLRGAGPQGLGGMRMRRPLAGGWLWRPLLDTPRAVLTGYLHAHAIDSIRDPSNDDPRHARNFLRVEVLPRLTAHWPEARQAVVHSARLSRQAGAYIAQRSRDTLPGLQRPEDASLDARGWLELDPALRGPVLDAWLHAQGRAAPTLAQRNQLLRQVASAAADRVPLVRWPGTAVHVWRGRLHAHVPLDDVPPGWKAAWDGSLLQLPAGAGTLQWIAHGDAPMAPAPTLEVRLGETGIRLRPAGDRHTRALRDLFQRANVPPWQRRLCPLIYDAEGSLLAVADLWHTDAGQALFQSLRRRPRWQPER
jgi:tRNA(Ile)-lysidine synthase